MNPSYETTTSQEWSDWYWPGQIDGAVPVLQSSTDYGIYDDCELYLQAQSSTGSYGEHANFDGGHDWAYLRSRPGYGHRSPLVARPDSGVVRPAPLTHLNSGSPSRPQVPRTSESLGSHDGIAIEDINSMAWHSYGQQPRQAQLFDHFEATRRASDLANTSSTYLDMELEPLSPSLPSSSAITRKDPPLQQNPDGTVPRRQNPKSASDEYTARWVRGDGFDREGWCGLCSTWHKLKDSAYWYHMHYTHGISCTTGKMFDLPLKFRHAQGAVGCEALCGGCHQWIYVGRREKWATPYFRHAYRCQVKNKVGSRPARSRPKSTSPRGSTPKHLKQVRTKGDE